MIVTLPGNPTRLQVREYRAVLSELGADVEEARASACAAMEEACRLRDELDAVTFERDALLCGALAPETAS